MIRWMETEDIDPVAALHMAAFGQRQSFATRLGSGVIRLTYKQFHEEGFGYVFVSEGEMAGVLAGSLLPARITYLRLVRRHFFVLSREILERVFRDPSLIRPVLKKATGLAGGLLRPSSSTSDGGSRQRHNVVHALSIAVSPSHRRRGIAKKLWLHALEDLPSRWKVDEIVGSVRTDDVATNSLYERMNFEVLHRDDSEVKWRFFPRLETLEERQ